jgi:hypothetical protein
MFPTKHWKEKYPETPPVKLTLHIDSNGLDGMVLNQSHSTITSVVIHVRVNERRKCGEKLVNAFSDLNLDSNCKGNPNYVVDDTVDGQAYECLHGDLPPYTTARCNTPIAMKFDPSKQTWDFFVLEVRGKPINPFYLLTH